MVSSVIYRNIQHCDVVYTFISGIFLVILVAALEAMYERRKRGDSCILLLTVSVCLFISITAVRRLSLAEIA